VSDAFGVEVELAGGAESVLAGGVELGFVGGVEVGVELCPLAPSVDPDASTRKVVKKAPAGVSFPCRKFLI
jgi:hypothetical protein